MSKPQSVTIRCAMGGTMITLDRIEDYPGTGWSEVASSFWLCPYHGSQIDSIDKVEGKLNVKFKPGTIMPKLPECAKIGR